MRRKLVLLACMALTQFDASADIIQSHYNGAKTCHINFNGAAQSFTANSTVANLASIGFEFHDANTFLPNAPMTMELYEGIGFSGPLLDTDTKIVTILESEPYYFTDFDFSGNTLQVGQVYTFRILLSVEDNRGCYGRNDTNPYPDGTQILNSGGSDNRLLPASDIIFRVLGDMDVDGIPNLFDNCPHIDNPFQENNDGDTWGDLCDDDDDNDGSDDTYDNCPLIANADQSDADFDGLGDACDSSHDGNSIAQYIEDIASAAVLTISNMNAPGGNGLIKILTGEGGVTQKVGNATTAFDDGLIHVTTYLSELNTALHKLDAFDNILDTNINRGKIIEPEATDLISASTEIRATIEALIILADD